MIRFHEGDITVDNATVTLGAEEHEAQARRDPVTGDIDVTVDTNIEVGGQVKLVLHQENEGTYKGRITRNSDGEAQFTTA